MTACSWAAPSPSRSPTTTRPVASKPRTRSCLVLPPLARATGSALLLVFDLNCLAGLVLRLDLVLTLDMRTSEVGDINVAPPRPRSGQLTAGSNPKTPPGASGINSNAPFAAEVQSNIEQSCCSTAKKLRQTCPLFADRMQERRQGNGSEL